MRPLPECVNGVIQLNYRINDIARSEKPHATVLDFVGNSGRHKLIMAVDILGGERSKRTRELVEQELRKSGPSGAPWMNLSLKRSNASIWAARHVLFCTYASNRGLCR
jgi:hypothetical protein